VPIPSRKRIEQSNRQLTKQQQETEINPTRVLIVDDHALVRAGIRELVGRMDGVLVVGEAGRGDEALRLVEEKAPDLLLLDITMPGMNGFEVLEEIGKRFPDVRVIILTMHEAREYAIQALHAGAAGYLPKSAATTELEEAIKAVAHGKTYVSRETPQKSQNRVSIDQRLLDTLTPRQKEILTLIAEGQSTKKIARSLDISVKTVESHRAQVIEKLGIHDIAGLVRFAIRMGLASIE
jgi:DNA-binding NarL/FixJ family response regulator